MLARAALASHPPASRPQTAAQDHPGTRVGLTSPGGPSFQEEGSSSGADCCQPLDRRQLVCQSADKHHVPFAPACSRQRGDVLDLCLHGAADPALRVVHRPRDERQDAGGDRGLLAQWKALGSRPTSREGSQPSLVTSSSLCTAWNVRVGLCDGFGVGAITRIAQWHVTKAVRRGHLRPRAGRRTRSCYLLAI